MTINEMHILFRTIGQQMGLQQVRGILPESIDNYLNVAIVEKCRSILQQNTSTAFQDKVTVRDNPISPINSLRTLYQSYELNIQSSDVKDNQGHHIEVDLSNIKDSQGQDIKIFEYISFFVEYFDNSVKQCRIVEHDKLGFVLADYCNSPDKQYPLVSITNIYSNNPINLFTKVYCGEIDTTKLPKLIVNYIKYPAKVSLTNPTVNCDLPDYLHSEIVEIAVNKFFQSVGSTTQQIK